MSARDVEGLAHRAAVSAEEREIEELALGLAREEALRALGLKLAPAVRWIRDRSAALLVLTTGPLGAGLDDAGIWRRLSSPGGEEFADLAESRVDLDALVAEILGRLEAHRSGDLKAAERLRRMRCDFEALARMLEGA